MADRDYFVAASECHLMGDLSHIFYYPEVPRLIESAAASTGRVWVFPPPPEDGTAGLVRLLDEAGVDVAFGLRESFMDTTGFAACWSTNGYVIQEISKYPDRLYLECNVGPVIRRGAKHANWELEYLVKNCNAKLCKVYQPEDEGPLNDPRMWPFYEKAQELGIPLTVHLGMAYVTPQYTKLCLPIQLDDVLMDFPDLKVIAYHMGWPYHEELFGLAGKHKNFYIGISGTVGWLARAPEKGYHMLGEALEWAGPDKIVFGLDWPGADIRKCVGYIRNLEIPEEFQEKWGYPAITDEIRAKILGLNLAKLTGIEPVKRVTATAQG